MLESENIGLVVFGLYLLTIIGIGLAAARYQQTSEDFWVAGRRFGLGVMIIANMAAIMHGGSILSGIAFAGRFGGVASLPLAAFAAGFAVIFFFFAKKLRQSGGFTIPDYMGDRFDSNWLRGWSAIVVAVSSTIYLIAQIRGMAFILETLLDVPFLWGLVVGTLIFVAYVALGGLLAVVWTNIAQFAFMWLGLLILAPFVYREVGGWFSVIEQVEAIAPGWTSVSGVQWTGWYMMSWYAIWFVAYCTRLELVTKMFAAKNDKVARYSLPWSVLLVIIFLLYGVFYLGAAARIIVWDQLASPDQAFPALVAALLTPTLAAIALTGIASAAMSTTDSLLLMSGSAIAHDLLRKCFHEPRNIIKDERYYVMIARLAIVGVGIIAFLCAIPDVALLLRIVSFAVAIVGAAFFFPLLIGLTSKRVSTTAAMASSIGGVCVTVVWIVATLNDLGWANTMHPGIPGLVTAGILMTIVTLFTSPVPSPAVAKYFPGAS
jgi:sodium/proline symporter